MTIASDVASFGPPEPGRLDLVFRPGVDLIVPLVWLDSDSAAIPMATNGYTAELEWSEPNTRADVLPTAINTTGGIVLADGDADATPNVPNMTLTFPGSAVSFRTADYSLFVTDSIGRRMLWLVGTATVGGTGS